jgi:Bacterial Ig-like domain
VLIVTPAVPLPESASVTIAVNGVRDAAGNAAPPASATFTTAAGADVVRPSATSNVISTMPVNSVFDVVFSEPMDVPSVLASKDQFLYDNTTGYVSGGTMTFSADGRMMSFAPPANLVPGRGYSINLGSSARDLSGNTFTTLSVGFTAAAASDVTPPQVRAVNPGDGLISARRNAKIEILFDEPVALTSLGSVNVLVGGNPIAIASRTLSNANRLLTVTPAKLLSSNTVHVLSIAGIEDPASNAMPTVTTTFTTGGGTDLTGPTTPAFSPVAGSVNIPVGVAPAVTFAEAIDPVRVLSQFGGSNSGVYLRLTSTSVVVPSTLSFSADFRTVTITPTAPLAGATQYQIVASQIYDVAANNSSFGLLTSGFTTAGGGALLLPESFDFSVPPSRGTPAFQPITLVSGWTAPPPSCIAPPVSLATAFFIAPDTPSRIDVANKPPR